MTKPGLTRAIPATILGFLAGALIVLIMRSLQNMDPVWDPEVALVLSPFIMTFAFIWGMGGFNPKMNEHAHGPEDAHHEHEGEETAIVPAEGGKELAVAGEHDHADADEEPTPVGLLTNQLWRVMTYTLGVLVVMFAVATLPLGLYMQQSNEDIASPAATGSQVFDLPLGLGQFEGSQLAVFLGFFFFTMLSIAVVAFVFYLLMYYGNREVTRVKGVDATPEQRRPPWIVRKVGGFLMWLARGIRTGLPGFLGQR